MFGLKKLQKLRISNGSGLALAGDSVKVLATYPISRSQNIIFVDVLDDVVVLGQSQNNINLLFKLDEEKVSALRQSATADTNPGLMQAVIGRLTNQTQRQDAGISSTAEAPRDPVQYAGTLEELARNLDQNVGSSPWAATTTA